MKTRKKKASIRERGPTKHWTDSKIVFTSFLSIVFFIIFVIGVIGVVRFAVPSVVVSEYSNEVLLLVAVFAALFTGLIGIFVEKCTTKHEKVIPVQIQTFYGPKCPSCDGTNTREMNFADRLDHGWIGTAGKTHKCVCGRTF